MSVFTLDDRDPAFNYTGFWGKLGGQDSYFGGTATWTNLSISTAVVSFTGVQITVFGSIAAIGDGAAPTTFYSLDNSPTKQNFTAVQQSQVQFNQQFFQSELLSSGDHTLEIQYLANEGQYILDYVQIQAAQPNPNQSSSTTHTSSSQTAKTTTIAPTSSLAERRNRNTAPIIGSIIGVIVLVLIGVIIWKRRRNTVTPFHLQPDQGDNMTGSKSFDATESNSPPPYDSRVIIV